MAKSDNCKYEYRPTIGHDEHGKPIRKSFYGKSRRAAKEKADKWILEHAAEIQNNELETPCPKFETVVSEYLANKKKDLRPNSYEMAEIKCGKLLEKFADVKINKIRFRDIQSFMNDFCEKYALSYAKNVANQMSAIMEFAIQCEYIVSNPAKGVKVRSDIEPVKKDVYTAEETEKVLEYCRSYYNKMAAIAVTIMLSYGTSLSEVTGIQYDDIDFENRTIHIHQGVTYADRQINIDKPKNIHRIRTIAVSKSTLELIQEKHNKKFRYLLHREDPEMPCNPNWFRAKVFKQFMHDLNRDTGIKQLNPHELRHTRATLWVEQDINLFAIAEEMGWTDLHMLRKVYGHPKIEKLRSMLKIDEEDI